MTSKHRQIANDLRDQIASGQYPPGALIPSLPALVAQYGVARETARSAVAVLTNEGLVTPRRHYGTVVRDTSPIALKHYGGIARPWLEQTSGAGRDEVVTVEWVPADADIADRLGVAVGAQVLHRVRHFTLGAEMAMLADQWIPESVVQAVAAAELGDLASPNRPDGNSRNLFQLFAAAGLPPTEITETLGARMPDPDEREVMSVPPGTPVLMTLRWTRGADRQTLEVSTIIAPGDRKTATFVVPVSY
jgi:GntR family transcriptional regulator